MSSSTVSNPHDLDSSHAVLQEEKADPPTPPTDLNLSPAVLENGKTDSPILPPEEGRKGWLCVLGSFAAVFCTFGFLNAIGLFQATYQTTILSTYSPSTISWIFAIQLCLMWIPGPLFGRIIDTYGPAPILYPCSFLCVFSLCMTSLSTKYYQILLAQGICFGLGAGGCFTASVVCCGQWFVRRRGLGVGIAASASGLGGVIFPIFFNKVMHEVGFNSALRYTALLIGILLFPSCFLVTSRIPHKKWNHDTKWIDFRLFKEKQIALYCTGSFFCMWGLWAPLDFLPSMALSSGFSSDLSLYLLSILNASSIVGRILPPHLGDTLGHFNIITLSALLTGLSILCLWLPFDYHPTQTHAGLIVLALVYGFASGSYVSLMMPCVAKAGSVETIGQRFGTYQLVVGASCLTGLPIMGAILNTQHGGNGTDYSGLQIFSVVCLFLGTSCTGLATYFVGKKGGTWRV